MVGMMGKCYIYLRQCRLELDSYNVSYPIYRGASYDASTTNLTYLIPSPHQRTGQTEITLSFFSPITPTSTFRQSIPAAYLTVHVSGSMNIDVYVDMNGHWVTGDRGQNITWDLNQGGPQDGIHGLKTWRFRRETEQYFTEFLDRAEWGTLHFTAPSDVRHESGTSAVLRQRFSRTGTLQNQIDSRPRKVMENEPVFAFSKSFRSNSTFSNSTSQSVMFTIAHIQNPVVQYASARGLTLMRPLWTSYFPREDELLTFHYLDFHNAAALAQNYSNQLTIDAYESGAEDYVDIVALSARQVMGATSFSGTPDNPILFLKEISSNGNFQTIDVIFPSFPFFLYTNPRWLAYLLEPLIEHMLSGQYPNKYAMHDLGSHFPNATGHPYGRDEYMPVEECGNILIMGLALVNSLRYKADVSARSRWLPTGKQPLPDPSTDAMFPLNIGQENHVFYIDEQWGGGPQSAKQARKWVERSYRLWQQWTGYLVDFSLRPHNQLSTDDFAGWLALQTNLALKGIIGIKAMEGLAGVVGNKADVAMYKNISDYYIRQWEEYGISRDGTHAKVAYNWYGSWTTTYNLYADALLCFHLGDHSSFTSSTIESNVSTTAPAVAAVVPSRDQFTLQKDHKTIPNDTLGFVPRHIYQMQSDWYFAVRQSYGLPLDSRHLYTKTDWEFFAMAVAAPRVRATILQSVAKWVNETETDRPLTDLHDTEGRGGFPGPNFFARPVVGGHFAFLTLGRACGGKAGQGLDWMDDRVVDRYEEDWDHHEEVQNILKREIDEALAGGVVGIKPDL